MMAMTDSKGNTCYDIIFLDSTANNDKNGWNEEYEIKIFY